MTKSKTTQDDIKKAAPPKSAKKQTGAPKLFKDKGKEKKQPKYFDMQYHSCENPDMDCKGVAAYNMKSESYRCDVCGHSFSQAG